MFKKSCPYCNELIDVGKLQKISGTEKLRWYQFTPAPRTACPKCKGFVKSTTDTSRLVLLVLAILSLVVFSSIYFLEVGELINDTAGGFLLLIVIIIPLAVWASKRAKLIKDKS